MYKRSLEGFKCIFDENINDKFIRSYAGYRLGKFYLYGTGTEIDYENAMKYFESSNNKYAYYSLGRMYQYGLGIEKMTKWHFIILKNLLKEITLMPTMKLHIIMKKVLPVRLI